MQLNLQLHAPSSYSYNKAFYYSYIAAVLCVVIGQLYMQINATITQSADNSVIC